MKTKVCSICGIKKPYKEYHTDNSQPSGIKSGCRKCLTKKQREYRENNFKWASEKEKNKHFRITRDQTGYYTNIHKKIAKYKKHGATVKWYIKTEKVQKGRCLICNDKVKLCVDHNHTTGQLRGLLCRFCNPMIGFCREDINILRKAIKYLEYYNDGS